MNWQLWLQVIPFVVLLVLGFSSGWLVERAHFRRLARLEEGLGDIIVTDLGTLGLPAEPRSAALVCGEVVIATDYFKTFVTNLRKLVGGELRAYESLMERGRREAIVRMLGEARQLDADAVINIRLVSSTVSGIARKRAAMVEVFAYGTAVRRAREDAE